MASIDFKKCKGGTSAKAIFRHCATDTREKGNHKNQDIDKTLTKQNLYYKTQCYADVVRAYDDRLKELEKTNKNHRKDAVTALCLEIPVPANIPPGKIREWSSDTLHILEGFYGADNLLGAFVHVDERHHYRDARDGQLKTSREHIHAFLVPELNGQLNAKVVMGRGRMREINNRVDDMTRSKYGLKFKTGEGKKRVESVEELKQQSETLKKAMNFMHKYNLKGVPMDELFLRELNASKTPQKAPERQKVENKPPKSEKPLKTANKADRQGIDRFSNLGLSDKEQAEIAAFVDEMEF